MDIVIGGIGRGKTSEINRRKELAKTFLKCVNCGEEISQYGPETFHVESTLIRCNLPENDGPLTMWTKAAVAPPVGA